MKRIFLTVIMMLFVTNIQAQDPAETPQRPLEVKEALEKMPAHKQQRVNRLLSTVDEAVSMTHYSYVLQTLYSYEYSYGVLEEPIREYILRKVREGREITVQSKIDCLIAMKKKFFNLIWQADRYFLEEAPEAFGEHLYEMRSLVLHVRDLESVFLHDYGRIDLQSMASSVEEEMNTNLSREMYRLTSRYRFTIRFLAAQVAAFKENDFQEWWFAENDFQEPFAHQRFQAFSEEERFKKFVELLEFVEKYRKLRACFEKIESLNQEIDSWAEEEAAFIAEQMAILGTCSPISFDTIISRFAEKMVQIHQARIDVDFVELAALCERYKESLKNDSD